MAVSRRCLVAKAAPVVGILLLTAPRHGQAADDELAQAATFIRQAGNRFGALANGSPTPAEKRRRLQALIDDVVDVDGVARFCLGRFWPTATPAQRQDYVHLFRDVLLNTIGPHVNDYPQGAMQVTINTPARNGSVIEIPTVVARGPEDGAALRVTWLVGTDTGRMLILDVVSEGMSLRLTQRSDYTSFLNKHDGSVDALLQALRKQAAANS